MSRGRRGRLAGHGNGRRRGVARSLVDAAGRWRVADGGQEGSTAAGRRGAARLPARAEGAGTGRASIGRIVSLLAFLPVASRVPDYARLIGALVIDERMPAERKVMLGAAAGYLVLGRDLIPDTIPIIGGLDDLVVVVLAVDVFLDGVPPELLQEKLDDLAIDRVAFDRDVAQIRRLTPGPVRRTIRRVPGLITAAGRAIERSGVVPRTRAPGSTRRSPPLEGHPDQGRPDARQERRAQAGRRRLRDELPHPAVAGRAGGGGAYRAWQHDIASREDKRRKEREEAEIAATRIGSTTLTMGVKVGEGGKLYGSITSKDIADALGAARHRGRPSQDRSRGAAQVARHVQGRDQSLHRHDARGDDRRRAEGLSPRRSQPSRRGARR